MEIAAPLSLFHPLVAEWFGGAMGSPSDIQARAWPEIAAGKHVLATAPTGSGKTLTAFLWAINQLVTRNWPAGRIRVLYISPLKALNNDVRENLTRPLAQLHRHFHAAGQPLPVIRVQTRSGDTPREERRNMLRHPPEILITTPESLNLLISSGTGRRLFTGLKCVILDEIHAVVAAKRGVHLMTAVERLVLLSGEFQRIALSATVRPPAAVARFIGGFRLEGEAADPLYVARPVTILQSEDRKRLELSVRFPEPPALEPEDRSVWPALTEQFRRLIRRNRSTLFFTNSRRLAEKIARLINETEPEPLAYSHHGSLSREIRLAVEQKMKNGDLRAIVATSSLELGIDIGSLDEVALIQTPVSVSSAVQRIGRSGHRVNAASRGILFPTHGMDFLRAAVMARAVADLEIESVSPPEAPLDVLAQVVLAMCAMETWDIDALFAFIRTCAPYHRLSRRAFDLVLEMLAGRYADTRIRELRPRIFLDRVDNTAAAGRGSLGLVYLAGGTIPDRGHFGLRLGREKSKIGELDEEFVWERRPGDTFALGTQTWRILRITENEVEVEPAESRPGIIPFWRAEDRNRDFHFSEKIGRFLEDIEEGDALADETLEQRLKDKYFMTPPAAAGLVAFLKAQREATRAPLPHRHHLLVEHFADPLNRADKKQVILHTLWGGRINRPFAAALSAAWERRNGGRLEVFANDDAILVMLPHEFDLRALMRDLHSGNLESLLRENLESSGLFGSCFRENAGRALLLPKTSFHKRMPLWLNRLRAKKLLDAVMKTGDFPLLLETWRTCLQDVFDLPGLKMLLDELTEGRIALGETVTTAASPFAAGLIWQQTNMYMYKDDAPEFSRKSSLEDDLIREVATAAFLRPRIPSSLIQALERKLQRTAPGYSPASAVELLDWVRERGLIPEDEWLVLLAAMERDHGLSSPELMGGIGHKLMRMKAPGSSLSVIGALENLPRLRRILSAAHREPTVAALATAAGESRGFLREKPEALPARDEAETAAGSPDPRLELVSRWLSYHGPIHPERLTAVFGLETDQREEIIASFLEEGRIILDHLREDGHLPEICDRQNLEILLRLLRKAARPGFRALPVRDLPLFLAAFQGLTAPADSMEGLQDRLGQLFGFCAAAPDWESWILPARLRPYYPAWLDSLMQSHNLCWFGAGKAKIGFAFEEDLELFLEPENAETNPSPGTDSPLLRLMPEGTGRWGLLEVARRAGLRTDQAAAQLWEMAWSGLVASDAFSTVRGGILTRFTPSPAAEDGPAGGRRSFNRWKAARPLAGNWFVPPRNDAEATDDITRLEIRKDRVRQLLQRHGLLFRELLVRELPLLQWRQVFKTLRLMELSGEVASGYFFQGIPGLQFASQEAVNLLRHPLPAEAVYWMNATDPASLCGLDLPELKALLPARQASTFLVFHGRDPVMICRRNGVDLEIRAPGDSPHLQRYLEVYKALVNREFNPRRFIRVETINDLPALDSPYGPALKSFGFTSDHKGYELRRRV
ncbi:MAG: DEAD/DEAH box helicase [Thermodesulfobacteriota bacterium]